MRHATPAVEEGARLLRREQTSAEVKLWQALRLRPGGLRFTRQHPLDRFILDFHCPSARLCVEVDGGVHASEAQRERDAERDAWLRRRGIRTLRLENKLVRADVDEAVRRILEAANRD